MRGFIEIVRDGVAERIRVRPAHAVRLARCNAVSGFSFFLGGALFTLGAVLSQLGSAGETTVDWTFMKMMRSVVRGSFRRPSRCWASSTLRSVAYASATIKI